jgi:hypothetical protein
LRKPFIRLADRSEMARLLEERRTLWGSDAWIAKCQYQLVPRIPGAFGRRKRNQASPPEDREAPRCRSRRKRIRDASTCAQRETARILGPVCVKRLGLAQGRPPCII